VIKLAEKARSKRRLAFRRNFIEEQGVNNNSRVFPAVVV
jgi:hypothetical protein